MKSQTAKSSASHHFGYKDSMEDSGKSLTIVMVKKIYVACLLSTKPFVSSQGSGNI